MPAKLGKNISKVTEISLVLVLSPKDYSSDVELRLLGRMGRVGTNTQKWAASGMETDGFRVNIFEHNLRLELMGTQGGTY